MVRSLVTLASAWLLAAADDVCSAQGSCQPAKAAKLAKDNVMLQTRSASVTSSANDSALRPCGANLAFGKPVSCSGNVDQCGPALTDGKSWPSRWFGSPRANRLAEGESAWVEVDLEAVTAIDEVILFLSPNRRFFGKKVQVSIDGQTWETVHESGHEAAGDPETEQGSVMNFEEVQQARYVRVHAGHATERGVVTAFIEVYVTCKDPVRCCNVGERPFERFVSTECTGEVYTYDHEAVMNTPAPPEPSYDYYEDEEEEYEFPKVCNGWASEGALTEEQCWEMCRTNAQAPHCPQRDCAAMRWISSAGTCHLYEAGQCDEVQQAPGEGIVLRKKVM